LLVVVLVVETAQLTEQVAVVLAVYYTLKIIQ
jgi:hypothetical protein